MTQYHQNDTSLTNVLIGCVDIETSWLRHRGGAGRLDWALLRGATSDELEDIRGGWRNHIKHLKETHHIEVLEEPDGYFRMIRTDIPLELPPNQLSSDDSERNGNWTETDDDVSDPASDEPNGYLAKTDRTGVRFKHTAKAIMALHNAGELRNPMHKAAIVMMIRQASECNHWHNSAHYRSGEAAKMIAAENIKTAAQYQAYCHRNLRHEHMVPNIVIYNKILKEEGPTEEWIISLFSLLSKRATITRDQDRDLQRSNMPQEFYIKGHKLFENPLARYIEAGLDTDLVLRMPKETWFPE